MCLFSSQAFGSAEKQLEYNSDFWWMRNDKDVPYPHSSFQRVVVDSSSNRKALRNIQPLRRLTMIPDTEDTLLCLYHGYVPALSPPSHRWNGEVMHLLRLRYSTINQLQHLCSNALLNIKTKSLQSERFTGAYLDVCQAYHPSFSQPPPITLMPLADRWCPASLLSPACLI